MTFAGWRSYCILAHDAYLFPKTVIHYDISRPAYYINSCFAIMFWLSVIYILQGSGCTVSFVIQSLPVCRKQDKYLQGAKTHLTLSAESCVVVVYTVYKPATKVCR